MGIFERAGGLLDAEGVEGGVAAAGQVADPVAVLDQQAGDGSPEEAAGAVYLFCLPEADYISGQTLMCTGGLTGI